MGKPVWVLIVLVALIGYLLGTESSIHESLSRPLQAGVTTSSDKATHAITAWSPDGQEIAQAGYFGLLIVDTQFHSLALLSKEPTSAIAWSPDSTMLAFSTEASNAVEIWDFRSNNSRAFQGHTSTVTGLSWSPTGQQIASGSTDMTVRIWGISSGQTTRVFQSSEKLQQVSWSPDGQKIAAGGLRQDLTVVDIWNVASGTILYTLSDPEMIRPLRAIVWKPDNTQLAFAAFRLEVWDTTNGKQLYIFPNHIDEVLSIAWSSDGKYIVSSGAIDHSVLIWNPIDQKVSTLFYAPTDIESLSWSNDSTHISGLSLDSAYIWDTSGQQQYTLALRDSVATLTPVQH